jgi:NAD(P)H-dependent FMN reductase
MRMEPLNLLVMPGSTRTGSLNCLLARFAATRARESGALVEEFNLRSLELPVYDGDIEAATGVPESVHRLRGAISRADAVLLVTPEYNGFPTPLVINAFDWMSRIQATASTPSGLVATANKPVGLMAASPGAGGALRSMNFLRQYLQMAFAMLVVPQQYALGIAHEAFDEAGSLKDARAVRSVDTVLQALAKLATAVRAGQ